MVNGDDDDDDDDDDGDVGDDDDGDADLQTFCTLHPCSWPLHCQNYPKPASI